MRSPRCSGIRLLASTPMTDAVSTEPMHEHPAPKLMLFGDPQGNFEPVIATADPARGPRS